LVPEAELKQTDTGLVPASTGWFVMNARDARWFHKPGQGDSAPLTGNDEFEAETYFPMLGMAIRVVGPGEPTGNARRPSDHAAIPTPLLHKSNPGTCGRKSSCSHPMSSPGPPVRTAAATRSPTMTVILAHRA